MGRAARWFRGLFGGRSAGPGGADAAGPPDTEKRRWGFVKSFREKEKRQKQQQHQRGEPPASAGAVMVKRKGSYREAAWPYDTADLVTLEAVHGDEQNKRAIAMAAATAAVAEAALAAAQAAAAVVRLTSSGRCVSGSGALRREEREAVKIQAAFRGYLARRALRALKGLVKLQALVRGNIVRKQVAGTLRCMHALVRVQTRARACRTIPLYKGSRPHPGSPTPEKYEQANAAESDGHCTLKRNSSNPISTDSVDSDRRNSSGWNWLDRWMEERYWDSRVASAAAAAARAGSCEAIEDEKNAKILEIDNGKPWFHPKRRSDHLRPSCSTVTSDQNNCSFVTVHDSPSKDSTTAHQSIPSASSVDTQQYPTPLRFPAVESGEFGESPQFCSAVSRPGSSRRDPFTPYKSECARSLFSGYSDYPNYMASTESSWAKVRSQSAPKQRPDFEKSGSLKGLSGHGIGQQPPVAASSQRSLSLHSKFTNKAYPGSGRLDRLGMPIRI